MAINDRDTRQGGQGSDHRNSVLSLMKMMISRSYLYPDDLHTPQ